MNSKRVSSKRRQRYYIVALAADKGNRDGDIVRFIFIAYHKTADSL